MTIDQTEPESEVSIMITSDNANYLTPPAIHFDNRRNTTANCEDVKDLIVHSSHQTGSGVVAIHRPSVLIAQRKFIMDLFSSHHGSTRSLNAPINVLRENHIAHVQRIKNRRFANDSLSIVLSALYTKFIFVLGIAFPITDIVSSRAPPSFYQGFYPFFYVISVAFVIFVYSTHLKNQQIFTILDSYEENTGVDIKALSGKKRIIRYGSFYLRVGAKAFGIGSIKM